MSCLFCKIDPDQCTCTDKILDRYVYLTQLITDLRVYLSTHTLSENENRVWHLVNNQVKEEQRKSKLLITYEPYKQKSKRKRITQ